MSDRSRSGPTATRRTVAGATNLDPDDWDAIDASHLGSVPREVLEELVADAIHMDIAAGAQILAESEASVTLVIRGVVRVFMTSPSGRQTTLRYIRRGGLFGVATLFADTAQVGSRAMADSRLLVFRSTLLREAANRDVRVALAFLRETSERVNGYIHELGASVFSTVRQRIVRHLLDSAGEPEDGAAPVAIISQQELADAAGCLRETVVRVLRELRESGLVQTGREGITLLEPDRLEYELWIPGR